MTLLVFSRQNKTRAIRLKQSRWTRFDLFLCILSSIQSISIERSIRTIGHAVWFKRMRWSALKRQVMTFVRTQTLERNARLLVFVSRSDWRSFVTRPLAEILSVGGISLELGVDLLAARRSDRHGSLCWLRRELRGVVCAHFHLAQWWSPLVVLFGVDGLDLPLFIVELVGGVVVEGRLGFVASAVRFEGSHLFGVFGGEVATHRGQTVERYFVLLVFLSGSVVFCRQAVFDVVVSVASAVVEGRCRGQGSVVWLDGAARCLVVLFEVVHVGAIAAERVR